ncbi:FecR family protein [Undibacterium umbellatum]|uniref:FecR domain-containing protein n=1 Tax=Undibacterium umbellatum TaxID=2762300 RepID=A0ABR6Z7R3_9BURK|nr:FecR family protein [Undibacterium umbellatum]MBC3907232.1 FecR domain-containing protein [Undibacterium umbellatum]
MLQIKNSTAIKFFFLAALCLSCALSFAAQVAGTVTHLSGPLIAKKADGAVKVLSLQSAIEQGDTLIAEKDTYARIKFADNSEIVLRPNTQIKIDQFSFEEDKPNNDGFTMTLVKGGLRAVTGLLGKRNKERFGLNTPTASIGIRGTTFIVEYVAPDSSVAAYNMATTAALQTTGSDGRTSRSDADAPVTAILPLQLAANEVPGSGSGRVPGLYVQVLDGTIFLRNSTGSLDVTTGQFGFAVSFNKPPVILPNNPGMQFTPPGSFPVNLTQDNASNESKSGSLICEVR